MAQGISRRDFNTRLGVATAGIVVGSRLDAAPLVGTRVIGANDRVVLASVGIRGQGNALKRGFARLTNVEIKTLCDPDANLAPERINDERLKDVASFKPGFVQDLRRALDDKDIDAIVIAAPNHWHALATVWGLQAGKHVFVEKPASHTVMEGRWMIDAAARYKKLVQVGTMNRSRPPCARRSSSFTRAASARSTWRADCASSRVRRSANTPTARWLPARSTRSP